MELFDRLLGTLSNAVQLRTQDSIVSSIAVHPQRLWQWVLVLSLMIKFNTPSFLPTIGSFWCQQNLYINNDQLSLRERRKIYLLSMSYICTIEQLDCIVLLSKYY